MKFAPEHFDDLRTKAGNLHASNLTRSLFKDIINDMEKLSNMITAAEVDICRHDENGAVCVEAIGPLHFKYQDHGC
jgi:hypothetical protein